MAKIAGIKLGQAYRRQYGCDFISVMPTNLYGPGDNFHPETSHVPAALLRRFHLPVTLAVADVPLQQLAAAPAANAEKMYDVLVARDLLRGRAELLQSLERQGVMVLDTVPERLTIDAVNRYLALKTGMRM